MKGEIHRLPANAASLGRGPRDNTNGHDEWTGVAVDARRVTARSPNTFDLGTGEPPPSGTLCPIDLLTLVRPSDCSPSRRFTRLQA